MKAKDIRPGDMIAERTVSKNHFKRTRKWIFGKPVYQDITQLTFNDPATKEYQGQLWLNPFEEIEVVRP